MSDSVSVPGAATKVPFPIIKNPECVMFGFENNKPTKPVILPGIVWSSCIYTGFDKVFLNNENFKNISGEKYCIVIKYKNKKDGLIDYQPCITGSYNIDESSKELREKVCMCGKVVNREGAEEIGVVRKDDNVKIIHTSNHFGKKVRFCVSTCKDMVPYDGKMTYSKIDPDKKNKICNIICDTFENCLKLIKSIQTRLEGSEDTDNIIGVGLFKKSLLTQEIINFQLKEVSREKNPNLQNNACVDFKNTKTFFIKKKKI